MKYLFTLTLMLALGFGIKAQTFSITFSNQVNPCNNNGSVDATASGGSAPYTYEWYEGFNATNIIATGSSLTNAGSGYYMVIATDANSITSQNYVYFTPVFQVYVTNITSADCPLNNGSVTYEVNGGLAPYDFVWSSGQSFLGQSSTTSTLTNLAPGEYGIAVTDANGCVFNEVDSVAYVSSAATFAVSTNSTPANCNDATVTAIISGTGTPPYTYYWNTTPPQTTATATGLNANEYPVVNVTDANGCMTYAYAYTTYGPSALEVDGYGTNATCPTDNGSISIAVSNGTAPYTYLWSNGATTQDIAGLSPGAYSLTVTDNGGCHITVTKYVGLTSNVNGSISTSQTNCSNNNGSALVSAFGGSPPYTYLWGNGATTSAISNLSSGYYGVTITDANGCLNNYGLYAYVSIPQACYNGISGYVYNDIDGDCNLNGNETALPWQIIDLGNGYYTSTWYDGHYQYNALATSTYTVSHTPYTNWNLICPVADYTVTPNPGQMVSGNDFYDQPTSLQNDMAVYVYGGLARPGFSHYKYYSIYNNGTTSLSGTIEITHDAQEVFQGGPNVTAYDQATRTITLTYTNLGPYSYGWGYLDFYLPQTVTLGNTLTTTAVVNPVAGDYVPADNYDTSTVTVVGSYDPNEKEVSPKGIGASGLISATNQKLDYTIHFQNTGTYPAQTVVIIDTLDQDLDITTFQLVGASHNVTWQLSGPRIVKFTFNSIYLPDSLSNEPGSHGLVSYRINQKPNLTGGTEIKNTAYIYFDYNAPIVTNTTLNTIEIVGIKENQFNSGISISPNPAQDRITISNKTKETCSKVEILDINGRLVTSIIPSSSTIQLPEMASGVYIVNAHYASGIYKEKLIISK